MTNIDQSIGPGLAGFIATFLLVVVVWLLFRSFTRHMRKTSHEAKRLGLATESGAVDGDAGGNEVADKA